MGSSTCSKTELYASARRAVQKLHVLSLMMAVVPAFAQSPARANSQNHRGAEGTNWGVEVIVFDPSDAVIWDAKVTLSHEQPCLREIVPLVGRTHRQECRCHTAQNGYKPRGTTTATDFRGVVRYRGVCQGSYEITVQAPGFSTVQQTVTIKKTEHLRVKLQIAVKTETVEVRAAPAVVDTIVNVAAGPLPYVPYRELDLIRLTVI